ncbi:MAG: hypothetical protein ACYS21_10240 [Planctomycetota bacterium]|jgi:hypothetical protein
MCKKLMFLISFVLLISWVASASAANLEVSGGTTYTVSGTENYDEWQIEGVVIVPEGATLTASERSEIDGEFPCGTMIVDGGTASVDARIDLGKGDGATLIVRNGGSFTQTGDSDGIKIPDDGGGAIRVKVYDGGTLTAVAMEVIGIGSELEGDSDRNARAEVGYEATIYTCDIGNSKEERYDPREWLENGDLYGINGVTEEDITIEVDGDCATVTTPSGCDPLLATNPVPADGEKGVASVVSDVVLEWSAACGIGTLGRHYLFFSTDKDCVDNAPSYSIGWDEPDCYDGLLLAANTTKNMGNFPNWTKLYWRVDEKLQTGAMIKGDTWEFTTGCDPIPTGDANLDCLVNLDDWALMLTTWGEEQFFPWD